MSIRVYGGEFLTSPVPLHLDMNWCTHGCFYCFANLNQPQRRLDAGFVRPLVRSLAQAEDDSPTLVQWLARRGYPVLTSNTVDPFAASNCRQFLEIHDALASVGVRFSYQTKGGDEEAVRVALDDAPTMWYVSLTSDREDLTRETEPGAPPHAARMELIAEARRRGHHVVVGVNPMVPDWWRDTDKLLADLDDAGVWHLWVQPIHLSRFQIDAMRSALRTRHADIIERARKKNPPDGDRIVAFQNDARAAGFRLYGDADGDHDFWRAYFDLGFPHWPTLAGWFDHLDQVGNGAPVVFGLDDLVDWCDVGMPQPAALYKEFIQPFARSIRNLVTAGETWRDRHHKPRNIREVIETNWHLFDYPTKLRHPCIAVAAELHADGENIYYTDAAGRYLLVYVPEGSAEELFDVEANRAVYLR